MTDSGLCFYNLAAGIQRVKNHRLRPVLSDDHSFRMKDSAVLVAFVLVVSIYEKERSTFDTFGLTVET